MLRGQHRGVRLAAAVSRRCTPAVAGAVYVTIVGWALFVVILAAVAGVAHLGIGTSSWVDPALVAGEMAVIAALAVSVLVKVGPGGWSPMDLLPLTALAGLR